MSFQMSNTNLYYRLHSLHAHMHPEAMPKNASMCNGLNVLVRIHFQCRSDAWHSRQNKLASSRSSYPWSASNIVQSPIGTRHACAVPSSSSCARLRPPAASSSCSSSSPSISVRSQCMMSVLPTAENVTSLTRPGRIGKVKQRAKRFSPHPSTKLETLQLLARVYRRNMGLVPALQQQGAHSRVQRVRQKSSARYICLP
jgi:hypothetical protein